MFIDFLLNTFRQYADQDAIVWHDTTFKYQWLSERTGHWLDIIRGNQINKGTIVILEADFSPNSIALFIALVEAGCVVVPLTPTSSVSQYELIEIAEGEVCLEFLTRHTT